MEVSALNAVSDLIYTGKCRLRGVYLVADEDKTLTITVEDNITAAGTNIKAFGRASGGNVNTNTEGGAHNFIIKFSREENLICPNGLYATLSATDSGDYLVYYDRL